MSHPTPGLELDTKLFCDVVMLSGGIDSTALALSLIKSGKRIRGIYFNFGQRSGIRQEAVVRRLGLELDFQVEIVNLQGILPIFLPIVDMPHPMMVEAAPTPACDDSITSIGIGGAYAANIGAKTLFYGATIEDEKISPRLKELLYHCQEGVRINTGRNDFTIEAPLIANTRADALEIMNKEKPNTHTWSCHWGGLFHCGECPGCKNRKERFKAAKVNNNTVYDPRGFGI